MPEKVYTDLDIQALIDDELEWEEVKEVKAYIERHPPAKENYSKWLQQKKLLKRWWTSHQEN